MNKIGIKATALGVIFNTVLFFAKFYVGISTNSLSIYCDAINNLGDTFACLIAVLGFFLARKVTELKSQKIQSLCTFVISLIIAATGAYFVYNGLQRLMYPLRIAYSEEYAYIIIATVFAKILMGLMYMAFNKKASSPVLKAMILDSFLDCAVTIFALMGLFLITKVNFAADGIFAIIIGTAVTVSAVKNTIEQSKFLINN
ncbi:cation diffusion facilitator family transporter [Eubacterium sp.]|uniref:cation diffusion facilitator family transporter n=1 Tax=Eubacterium sp. TaxID=142586 RepID=UPI0025C548FE|nr:cation transporter [Eubacterium sp.]